jgi:hypothetical protein
LFEIVGTKSLDSNAIDFTKTGINFVGRTFENNGIQGKIQKRNFEPNEQFTITATVIGNFPPKSGKIDFEFMESFIAELEAEATS